MANTSLYEKIVAISPHIEMVAWRVYWLLLPLKRKKKVEKNKKVRAHAKQEGDFDKILNHLTEQGLKQGDILVVHSSFSAIKKFGLPPAEVVQKFLDLLGPEGTLVMPAFPIYPNRLMDEKMSEAELVKQKYVYDMNSDKIWTGALAKAMLRKDDSERSCQPLNPTVAIGAQAKAMMKDNHKEIYTHGPLSSWNYCALNGAFVLGLGTDLPHCLTILHVSEDRKNVDWPIKNWYQDRTFIVKDKSGEEREVNVKERRYRWGMLHYAERNTSKHLIRDKVMSSHVVEGVLMECLRGDELMTYLEARNEFGYPYYWGKLKK